MHIIKFITLELRPRLQTCNAFICLKEAVNLDAIKIKLLEENIILSIKGNDTNFHLKSVKLIPTSLSALSVTNDWISFHIQTRSEGRFGSFKAEIIANPGQSLPFSDDSFKANEPLKGSSCNILCKCCQNVISQTINFQRVLPYPDLDYMSDWFCHSHGNPLPNIAPQENDLFYGTFFSIVHRSLFTKNLRIDRDVIICSRCLNHLGGPSTGDSYKLWNCCVNFVSLDNREIKAATDPLADFFLVIKSSLNGILGEELVLQFRAGKEAHYLFVKPINQQLTLMTEPNGVCNGDVISLGRISVMKVLYRYETDINRVTMIHDNRKYCDVSLPVIEAGFKHLLSSTRRFPQMHRIAAGYYIGHVNL